MGAKIKILKCTGCRGMLRLRLSDRMVCVKCECEGTPYRLIPGKLRLEKKVAVSEAGCAPRKAGRPKIIRDL